MISPELQSKIERWRAGCKDGTIKLEELREAIRMMRGERYEAQKAASAYKSKSAKKSVDADAALAELGI